MFQAVHFSPVMVVVQTSEKRWNTAHFKDSTLRSCLDTLPGKSRKLNAE